jgi:hypothetical protein
MAQQEKTELSTFRCTEVVRNIEFVCLLIPRMDFGANPASRSSLGHLGTFGLCPAFSMRAEARTRRPGAAFTGFACALRAEGESRDERDRFKPAA